MRSSILYIFTAVILFSAIPVTAEKTSYGVGGGVSFPIGFESGDWNTGFDLNVDAFHYLIKELGFGFRFAYNRWTPDENRFKRRLTSLENGNVSGSIQTFELLPSVRIRTTFEHPVNYFFQGGLGAYIIHSKATVTGSQFGGPVNASFDDMTTARFGFSFGPGISVGSWKYFNVSIVPLYNLVFNSGKAFQYITGNINILFGY